MDEASKVAVGLNVYPLIHFVAICILVIPDLSVSTASLIGHFPVLHLAIDRYLVQRGVGLSAQ